MIELTWDDSGIQRALHNLQQATQQLNTPLNVIGLKLVESTKQRFETSTAPDGTEWKENRPVTIARKGTGKKPLIGKNGKLMDQISYSVSGNELLVYSTMEYAAMQQFGGTKAEFNHLWGDIPARPYLGLSSADELMIQRILDNYLKNAF